MRKTITRWATCGLGLMLLMSSGCAGILPPWDHGTAPEKAQPAATGPSRPAVAKAPAAAAKAAAEQTPATAAQPAAPPPVVAKPPAMTTMATVPKLEAAEPEAAAEKQNPVSPSPVIAARTTPTVYRFTPDDSSSLGTEDLLSELCKEVAGKVFYRLKLNGERHLTSRVAVVAAVPLSDLKRETEFGRLVGEELLTDLADRGLKVTELRLGREINILPQTGEFILTRNIGELANEAPMLDYVVVSTFTNTRKTLILQGRLVGLKTGLVETSWRYTLPLNRELLGLFHEAEQPFTIAVKGMRR